MFNKDYRKRIPADGSPPKVGFPGNRCDPTFETFE